MSTPKAPRKARSKRPKLKPKADPRAWPKVRPRSSRPPPDAEPLHQRHERPPTSHHGRNGGGESEGERPILVTLSGALVNALLFTLACIIAVLLSSCASKLSERTFPTPASPTPTQAPALAVQGEGQR